MESFTGPKNPSRRRLPKQKVNMRSQMPRNSKNLNEETVGFSDSGCGSINNSGFDREFLEFRQFVKERTEGGGRKCGNDIRNRLAASKVKNLLDHQLAMLKLTRQMNKLLSDLTGKGNPSNYYNKHGKNNNSHYFESQSHPPPHHMPNSNTNGKGASSGQSKKSKKKSNSEYIIFSGGPKETKGEYDFSIKKTCVPQCVKGLEYSSLKKSKTGTFRMEIDVSEFDPEHISIHTDDKKTMHVKASKSKSGERKTLKIVSPIGIDIDDVKIFYPSNGILLLEAP